MAINPQEAMMSRPTTSGFSKSTDPVKGLVPPEVKEAFTRKWRELGYPSESDAVREIIILFTFGAEFLQKVHRDRIQRIADSMAAIGTEEVR